MKKHLGWGLILLAAGVIIVLTVLWPQPLGIDRSPADPVVRHYDQPDYEQCSANQAENERD